MKRETHRIKLTFTDQCLGSAIADPDILEEFIAVKAPTYKMQQEEVEAVRAAKKPKKEGDEVEEIPPEDKSLTIFPRNVMGNKELMFWDYQVRGAFKEAFKTLIELGDIKSLNRYNVTRAVDSVLLVNSVNGIPRRLILYGKDNKPVLAPHDYYRRSLRATTPMGDRICITTSEALNAGTWFQFDVTLLRSEGEGQPKKSWASIDWEMCKSALDWMSMRGFGQWRSGGWGRFVWEELPLPVQQVVPVILKKK